ncbi:hypothetical protein Tco_1299318, partial [Tanacetum coccineum]
MKWEDDMILYCRRAVIEDCMLAKDINRLCEEVVVVVEERVHFLEELDCLPGRIVPEKTVEFLREIQRKDTEKLLQLHRIAFGCRVAAGGVRKVL